MAKKTFEQSLQALEQIVQELETGELPLEIALKKFEEGMKVARMCTERLDEIEKKVTFLLQDSNGNLIEKPFPETSPDDSIK